MVKYKQHLLSQLPFGCNKVGGGLSFVQNGHFISSNHFTSSQLHTYHFCFGSVQSNEIKAINFIHELRKCGLKDVACTQNVHCFNFIDVFIYA